MCAITWGQTVAILPGRGAGRRGVLILTRSSVLLINRHMLGMGRYPMMGMGSPAGNAPLPSLYRDFRAGYNEALTYAILAAILVAVLLGLFFSRKVIAPLRAMTQASQRIAEGHYEERVEVRGEDELAELAARFNLMAANWPRLKPYAGAYGDGVHELRTPPPPSRALWSGLIDGVLPAERATYEQIAQKRPAQSLVDDRRNLAVSRPAPMNWTSIH
jgi:methyl-accepting chemotaxis protein